MYLSVKDLTHAQTTLSFTQLRELKIRVYNMKIGVTKLNEKGDGPTGKLR